MDTGFSWRKAATAVFLAVFLVPSLCSQANAQTGTLVGTVIDGEYGDELIGANVLLEGTMIGTSTGLDGTYRVTSIPPGTYSVKFSFIGYQTLTVSGVEILPGDITRVDATLAPEAFMLEGDVVVEARAIRDNEATLLKDRQKAIAVSDAISAEMMAQSGVSDAAGAMSRVTGASVQDSKYVIVRGLGGRYGNAQLNGASLPSADPDKNATQLDLFPTGLLDNIVTTKTFTPDKPGNFSGGSVDVRTKNFPDQLLFKVTTSTAYNSNVSGRNDLILGQRSTTDWRGFDDGLRDLPEMLTADDLEIPRATQARSNEELATILDTYSRSFQTSMVPVRQDAFMDQSYSVTFGNQTSLFGRRLGFVASGSYGRGFSSIADGRTAQYNRADPNVESLNADYDLVDNNGKEEVSWSGMGSLAYKIHPLHEISLQAMRSQVTDHEGRIQQGVFPKNSPETVTFETFSVRFTERFVTSLQARGEHVLAPIGNLKADWLVSMTNTEQDEPDLRFFFDQFIERTPGDPDSRIYDLVLGSSNASPPTRLFRSMSEENQEMAFNLELPFKLGSRSASVKSGVARLQKDRAFRERKFDYVSGVNSFSAFNGNIAEYFGPENVGIVGTDHRGRYQFGNTIRDNSIRANNFDGDQTTAALYLMADVPVTRRIRVIGGVRVEDSDMEIVSFDSTKAPGTLDNRDWLPSVNVVYGLGENMNVRAAVTRTLARPTFREKAPFSAFDFAGGRVTAGNPELQRSLISNYDLRWEWFLRPGELVSVSGFYKYIQDPIERVIVSNNNQETFQNVGRAEILGAEFEARKRLDFIWRHLANVMVSANLAVIDSDTDVPQREKDFATGFEIGDERPFQGQAEFVFNTVLSWDVPKHAMSTSLSFNRLGRQLSSVSIGGTPNIFEYGRNDLNATFSKTFIGNVTVSVAVKNLLDDDYLTAYELGGERYTATRYRLGRTYSIGVSYGL
ncbi:MAG: TonB-dependent receptor [Rhodothermales bacterium]